MRVRATAVPRCQACAVSELVPLQLVSFAKWISSCAHGAVEPGRLGRQCTRLSVGQRVRGARSTPAIRHLLHTLLSMTALFTGCLIHRMPPAAIELWTRARQLRCATARPSCGAA